MNAINWQLNQPANIPDAFEAGRQIGRQRQKENALAKAAKSFGAGDYKTASNDLFQYAPDLAMQTQKYGQEQAQQQARVQAGTMAASGDLQGAADRRLRGGEQLRRLPGRPLAGPGDVRVPG
jgi:hypothetical protein